MVKAGKQIDFLSLDKDFRESDAKPFTVSIFKPQCNLGNVS